MQKDLSLKVNEDDACLEESTFRHLEELHQTFVGFGRKLRCYGDIIRQEVDGNGYHILSSLPILHNCI